MTYLVTGCAGFIGFHLVKHLLIHGENVVGIDNINDYYDIKLKYARLDILKKEKNFSFYKTELSDFSNLLTLFEKHQPVIVYHLAAQAGVRYSLTNPNAYVTSNLVSFVNILECCKKFPPKHFIFASSSSVYGANIKVPFIETDPADHPVSLYAATKRSNELIAHSYSHLNNLPTTGLRLFTVYGPWGRPDMAPILFAKAISEGKKIDVFNFGDLKRDFTFIDDIIDGLYKVSVAIPQKLNTSLTPADSHVAPFRVFNMGNNNPIQLMTFINLIEEYLNKKAVLNLLPMQPGDVFSTFADTNSIKSIIGYSSQTTVEVGLKKFIDWFKSYYNY